MFHMAEGVVVVLHRWVALELVEQENHFRVSIRES